MIRQPDQYTNLSYRLKTTHTAPSSAVPSRFSLNNTYLWESPLLAKEDYPALAQSMLEHFCHRPAPLSKSTTHQLIQHLQACLKNLPDAFPCPRCSIALTTLGYPSLLEPGELFLEYA